MSKSEYTCNCMIVHPDVVSRVKQSMEENEEYKPLTSLFKVLGDETRIKILWALDMHEMCVCDICNVLDMTKSAVSHQLGTLRKAHLVKCRKEGKSVYYSLDDDHVRQIFEMGLEHMRHLEIEKKQ